MCINLCRISAKEAVLLGNNKGTQACGNSVSQTFLRNRFVSLWGRGVQTPSHGKRGRDRHEPLHLQRGELQAMKKVLTVRTQRHAGVI